MFKLFRESSTVTQEEEEQDSINEYQDQNYIKNPVNASVSSIKRREVQVSSIYELHRADHVKIIRFMGYSHHAIIENINLSTNQITVIEYTNRENYTFLNKGVIKRSVYNYADIRMLNKFIYNDDVVDKKVLLRARSRLGEEKYNLLFNNCEHFATWSRTGINKSLQAQDVGNSGLTSAVIGGLSELAKKFSPAMLAEIVERYSAHAVGAAVAVGCTVIEAIYELYKLIKDLDQGNISTGVFKDSIIILVSKYSFATIALTFAVFITSPTTIPGVILSGIFVAVSGILGKWLGKCFGTFVNWIRRNWEEEIIDFFKQKIVVTCKDAFFDFIDWLLGN